VAVPLDPLLLAVMVELPAATAVTSPLWFTVATEVVELNQLAVTGTSMPPPYGSLSRW
jgi:hypothetical protein